MLRKFLLTGFPLLTRLIWQDSNTEAVWGTMLMTGLLIYISSADPYVRKSDQYLSTPTHLQLVITMVAGLGESMMEQGESTDIFVAIAVLVLSDGQLRCRPEPRAAERLPRASVRPR